MQCEQENSYIKNVQESEDFVEHLDNFAVPKLTLRDKLKKWCVETAPSRNCLEKLLLILKEEGLDGPLSKETVLGKITHILVRSVSPGSYCHIGIDTQLRKVENVLVNYDEAIF